MNGKGAGRLFVLGFEGQTVPDTLVSFAGRYGLGGVILFARNCPDAKTVRELTGELKRKIGPGLLVMIDQEGGRVERIKDGVPRLPPARELSFLTEKEIEELAEKQARGLKSLGVDVNLAPVADVVRPGESGVIGDRSFGGDPEKVARAALAFCRGLSRGGIIPCAKHFPGHGSSVTDTHLGAGVVPLSRETLMDVDVYPFARLVSGAVPMVMACHLSYPAVDPLPACLSGKWLKETLRDGLGFDGVVITDDMEMGAAKEAGDPSETALAAIKAGADMLIYGGMLEPRADVELIAAKLTENADPRALAEAKARVDRLGAAR